MVFDVVGVDVTVLVVVDFPVIFCEVVNVVVGVVVEVV